MKTQVIHVRCTEAQLSKVHSWAKLNKKTISRFVGDSLAMVLEGGDFGALDLVYKMSETLGRTPGEIFYEMAQEKASRHNLK